MDLGLLPIKNIDLLEKFRRNTKRNEFCENRKNLGKSIEERPEIVEAREDFGHWEIDSILGKKGENEPAVISLTERKHRQSLWLKVKDHSSEAVDEALAQLFETFGDKNLEVLKTITTDNGSEFANLSNLEGQGIGIYFTHPYTSCEKGTVERHNRMLRRFIPKGKSIDNYTADEIMIFADIINGLPRKILGYRTPEELFDAELDRIYAVRLTSIHQFSRQSANPQINRAATPALPFRSSLRSSLKGKAVLSVNFLLTIATCYCNLRFSFS